MRKTSKQVVCVVAITLIAILGVQSNVLASPTEDDVWRQLGIDPNSTVDLDGLTAGILRGMVKIIRLLSISAIPIAVAGSVLGALFWGAGSLSQNDRVKKTGIVMIISMCFLPLVAKLAPILVASMARGLVN